MKKIDLNRLFGSEQSKLNFFYHSILTFRLQTDSIIEMFDTENLIGASSEEEVFNYLMKNLNGCHDALIFLFNVLHNDQEHQKQEFYKYYQKLVISRKTNKELFIEYLRDIEDVDYYNIVKMKKEDYTLEDYKVLGNFQRKYALSSSYIADVIGKQNSTYGFCLKRVFQDDPYFLNEYQQLMDYTTYLSQIHHKSSQGS